MISKQDISVLYYASVRYDKSVGHDTTAVWYDILSQTCVTGIMTFRCFDPSMCWPFGAPVFRRMGFEQTICGHIEEIIATNDFEQQQKEWDIVKGKFLLAFSAQRYDTWQS